MILNAYAILDAFVVALRLMLSLMAVRVSISMVWQRQSVGPEAKVAEENRGYLLFQLALVLLVLNAASWPLLYLLLDSYVPEWPGVMCIYGVTQIGSGSSGASRYLPGLLQTLQILKPLLVFTSGVWLVLYLANRRTAHSPLMGKVLLVLAALALLGAVDAALEMAYLVIPKQEEFLATGCCTSDFTDEQRFLPSAVFAENGRSWLVMSYFAANCVQILAMFRCIRRLAQRSPKPGMEVVFVGAIITLVVQSVFLIDVAAPKWLGLPHHHCPYDLLTRAPEALVGLLGFTLGTFAAGWACVAWWWGHCPETESFLSEMVRKILVVGLIGYGGALAMMSVELALP